MNFVMQYEEDELVVVYCVPREDEWHGLLPRQDAEAVWMQANAVLRRLSAEFGVFVDYPHAEVLGAAGRMEDLPAFFLQACTLAASSGITITGLLQGLRTWIDARNGRKLKIKVGEIEVEATQMNPEEVLRIFELLEEKADRKKIRELLLTASKEPPTEGR
jgi:hypothetical protein